MYKYSHDTKKETRRLIEHFGGINETGRAAGSESVRMKNMTCDRYPLLCSRKKRRASAVRAGDAPTLFEADSIGYITGDGTLCYDGDTVVGLCEENAAGARQTVMLGSRLAVFPDGVWYDTASGMHGKMALNEHYSASLGTLALSIVYPDGSQPAHYVYSATEPDTLRDNTLWFQKNAFGEFLTFRYYASTESWVRLEQVLHRFYTYNNDIGICVGDYINIDSATADSHSFPDICGEHRVTEVTDDHIGVLCKPNVWLAAHVCNVSGHCYALDTLNISRYLPPLDYVCSCRNRLWGCSTDGHEIFATAPGTVASWRRFEGTELDSWSVQIGSPGRFTGCGVWGSQPIFFKEKEIIRIFGSKPSDFSAVSCVGAGIGRGNAASLACVGDGLCYKGTDGFYFYSGGYPQCISRGLDVSDGHAFCAGLGGKYYAVCDGRLLVYDRLRDLWCEEECGGIVSLCACENDIFAVQSADGGHRVVSLCECGISGELPGMVLSEEGAFPWSIETGSLTGGIADVCIREVRLEIFAAKGAELAAYYRCGDGRKLLLGRIVGDGTRKCVAFATGLEVCDRFAVILSGQGEFRLYAVEVVEREV